MYIVLCYVFKGKGPNLSQGYKTLAAAKKRAKKALESQCYEKVAIIERKEK